MGNSKIRSAAWFDEKNADGTFKHGDYALVVIDHEVSSILETLPPNIRKQAEMDEIGFLFVKVGDAEITQIWGGWGTVPYSVKNVYLLLNSSGGSYYSNRQIYTVYHNFRDGYLPDSEFSPAYSDLKALRDYLSDLKRNLQKNDYCVKTSTPLKAMTQKLFKRYPSIEYIQYSPKDASDNYMPYAIRIERE